MELAKENQAESTGILQFLLRQVDLTEGYLRILIVVVINQRGSPKRNISRHHRKVVGPSRPHQHVPVVLRPF